MSGHGLAAGPLVTLMTMDGKAFGFDMTMMYAMHDALRRELVRIARVTANRHQDPQQVLDTAVGWEMFKSYLRVHHTGPPRESWRL